MYYIGNCPKMGFKFRVDPEVQPQVEDSLKSYGVNSGKFLGDQLIVASPREAIKVLWIARGEWPRNRSSSH